MLDNVPSMRSIALSLIGVLVCGLLLIPKSHAQRGFDRAQQATVHISAYKEAGEEIVARASGFYVHPDGWILTNKHVVTDDGGHFHDVLITPTSETDQMDDACAYRVNADAILLAPNDQDLALLIPSSKLHRCDIPSYLTPKNVTLGTSEQVRVFGYPGIDIGGESLTVTHGKVAGRIESPGGRTLYLKIDANIGPGNSGGPVVDRNGELIGVATAISNIIHNSGLIQNLVGIIIPSSNVLDAFPELASVPSPLEVVAEENRVHPVDVSRSAWFSDAVQGFVDEGYIDPAELFRPGDRATRAEFISLIVDLLGGIENGPFIEASFDDVPTHSLYFNVFEEAAARGLLKGSGGCLGTHPCFAHPEAQINRAEAATLLLRAFALQELASAPQFADNQETAWYFQSIRAAASVCVLQGDASGRSRKTVRPGDNMNRAEMIVMLQRLHDDLAYPECVPGPRKRPIPSSPNAPARVDVPRTVRSGIRDEDTTPPCTASAWRCTIRSGCSRSTRTQTKTCELIDRECSNPQRAKPPTEVSCRPNSGAFGKMSEVIDYGESLLQTMGEQILDLPPAIAQQAIFIRNEYEAALADYQGLYDGMVKYRDFQSLYNDVIEQKERELEAIENRFFRIHGTQRPSVE